MYDIFCEDCGAYLGQSTQVHRGQCLDQHLRDVELGAWPDAERREAVDR